MIITPYILAIPPYLSTTWKNITTLHAIPYEGRFQLAVLLDNNMKVIIPNLDQESVEKIFEAHARFGSAPGTDALPSPSTIQEIGTGTGVDLLNASSQHNPDQADSPDFPPEVLKKIAGIAQVLGMDDATQLPEPEPHCNCPFCQIARAFRQDVPEKEIPQDEVISLDDLSFRNWEVTQRAEKLYDVVNPLDENEHYSVFLGEPLGCTCGQKNCEHIRTVLST